MDGSIAPVLLLVFNRPRTTAAVLAEIRKAAPRKMFVAADGPRDAHPQDRALCAQVLELVRREITWECEVQYLVQDRNLGCGRAPAAGISWFFQNVDEGIILEDDCVPAPQFFPFASSLLSDYRDEPRVTHIAAYNAQRGRKRGDASYYFSRIFHCWGWASWRRAWEGFDFEMKDYRAFLSSGGLEALFERPLLREFWRSNFDAATGGDGSIWDYQWVYRNFKTGGLAVVPNWNMVSNIGIGPDATHTFSRSRARPVIPGELPTEIRHPAVIEPDLEADDFEYRTEYGLGRWHEIKHLVKPLVIWARPPRRT